MTTSYKAQRDAAKRLVDEYLERCQDYAQRCYEKERELQQALEEMRVAKYQKEVAQIHLAHLQRIVAAMSTQIGRLSLERASLISALEEHGIRMPEVPVS